MPDGKHPHPQICKDMNGWHYRHADGRRIPVTEEGWPVGKTPAVFIVLRLNARLRHRVWWESVESPLQTIEQAMEVLRLDGEFVRIENLKACVKEGEKLIERLGFLGDTSTDNAVVFEVSF